MKSIFHLTIIIELTLIQWVDPSYYAAVVEFKDDYERTNITISEEILNSAHKYATLVAKIKENNKPLDIVVFPEATLIFTLNFDNLSELANFTTFVPSPGVRIAPCNDLEHGYGEHLKILSCAARQHKTYLVVNLYEREACSGENCASYKYNLYNTNVVFDRSGTVIARYRKFNLFYELSMNVTAEPESVTFKKDFGVTFGTFTCFDILFKSPAMDLIHNGVRHFALPTMWFSEMPFFTGLQVQQMWAQGNDVVFLAAGAVAPSRGNGGSGIFLGSKGPLVDNIQPVDKHTYIYSEVAQNDTINNSIAPDANDDLARKMDQYITATQNFSAYNTLLLDTRSRRIVETVCQGKGPEKLCCNFDIEIDLNERIVISNPNQGEERKKLYNYALVARSGTTIFSFNRLVGIEQCGIVPCTNRSMNSCGRRHPKFDDVQWPITFRKIKITANFTNTVNNQQLPNSLLADLTPISPAHTTWESRIKGRFVEKTYKLTTPVRKLLTFAIIGRNFTRDRTI